MLTPTEPPPLERQSGKSAAFNSVAETPFYEQHRPDQLLLTKAVSNNALTRASLVTRDWTPNALVISYLVFSISLYTLFTPPVLKAFWFLYLTISTYIAAVTTLEAFDSLTPLQDARKALRKVEEKEWEFATAEGDLPCLDLVINADASQNIVLDHVHSMLERVVYPRDKLQVTVFYNETVVAENLDGQLSDIRAKHSAVRLIQAPRTGTVSMSTNIKHLLSLGSSSEITAFFECGQYPHPLGPRWAVERLVQDEKADIVQGRRVLSSWSSTVLSSLLSIEHDMIYAVSQPGRAAMWGFGVFNGSNGYWRTSVLQNAVTTCETPAVDGLDLGFRAFSKGAVTVHDMNVIAYESGPTTVRTYWTTHVASARQWALASARYTKLAFTRTPKGRRKRDIKSRLGILSMLLLDRLGAHAIVQYFCMALGLLFTRTPRSPLDLAYLIYLPYDISIWLIVAGLFCLDATVTIVGRARSEFVSLWTVPIALLLYPFLLVFKAVVDLLGQAKQIIAWCG
ncbi:hypothetical protein LTR66_012285 [Elasticomyces elasticus]|nr:hypothetical protein LTR66_012285 [Elasticomyces elasticus]